MAVTKSKYKLVTLPNPLLRQSSKKVGIVNEHTTEVIEAMQRSIMEWENSRKHEVGVALAATQIGEQLRIVVVRNNFDDKDDRTFTVFINPIITKLEGTILEDFEGCLSVPDIYGKVPRYSKARIKAKDMNGREFRISAEGFLARIFQHEIDHTNGKLFIDHIKDMPEAFYVLMPDGNLEKLDYEKDIRNSHTLWK
jgi:peptide deformylase